MKEQPKFRAFWQGNMWKVYGIGYDDEGNYQEVQLDIMEHVKHHKHIHQPKKFEWVQVPLENVTRCTGQPDKHGTEIYERDVVSWPVGEESYTCEVTWETDQAGFLPNHLTKDPIVEVIGNIYEDPELLKEVI